MSFSAIGLAWMLTVWMVMSFRGRSLALVGSFSIRSRVSQPSMTLPKMVQTLLRWVCFQQVMKNWLPFWLGPLLAMLRMPLRSCFSSGMNSSLKAFPQIDCPPRPLPVGSPPYRMNCLMLRWNTLPLQYPEPHRAKKFLQANGASSQCSSSLRLPWEVQRVTDINRDIIVYIMENPLEEVILGLQESGSQMPEQLVRKVVKQVGFRSNDSNSYKAMGLLGQHFLEQIIEDIDCLQNNRSKKAEEKKTLKKPKSSHQKCFTLKDLLEEFEDKGVDVYKVPFFPETDFQ